jgi:hypothetical protein
MEAADGSERGVGMRELEYLLPKDCQDKTGQLGLIGVELDKELP